jgi:hypothetical protein
MGDRTPWETDDPIVPNHLTVKEALDFVWSLPVSVLITGAENKELLQEKIELAKEFNKYKESDRINLIERISEKAGNSVEYYKKV